MSAKTRASAKAAHAKTKAPAKGTEPVKGAPAKAAAHARAAAPAKGAAPVKAAAPARTTTGATSTAATATTTATTDLRSGEPAASAPGSGRVRDPMLSTGLALIVVQAVVRTVLVGRGYFWQDDFVQLAQARRMGLSAGYLFQDYSDHLQPGQYVLIWLTAQGTGLHYAAAAATMVAMQAAASLALLWALRQFFGASLLLLVPFTAYLFTPLLLMAGTWWSASLQAFPMQIAMLVCFGTAALYFRTTDWRWMACSWAAFVLGLCFWEKALLILPALLGVTLLILDRDQPVRSRLTGLRRHEWFWAGHVAIVLGYVVAYLSAVDVQGQQHRSATFGPVVDRLIVQTLISGMFGGPWTGDGVRNSISATPNLATVVATSALLIGLIVLSIMLRGSAAIAAWALLAGYLAVDVVLLAELRTGYSTFLARDPRYITDALPVAAICAAAAFLPRAAPAVVRRDQHPAVSAAGPGTVTQGSPPVPVPAPGSAPVALPVPTPGSAPVALQLPVPVPVPVPLYLRIEAATTPSTGAVLMVALAFSALITTSQVSYALRHGYAKAYATSALAAARENSSLHLVDALAPPVDVVPKPVSTVFAAAGVHVIFDQPSTQLKILDGFGQPQPVGFLAPTLTARGPKKDCGWAVGPPARGIATVPAASPVGSVLRVGYLSGTAWTMHITVGGAPMSLAVPKGLGLAYFPLGTATGRVTVSAASTTTRVCVSDVTAGAPWPSQ